MKKLLFLFPIQEYIESLWGYRPEVIELLNQIINERYRSKGYQIFFLSFENKPLFGVELHKDDKVIEGNITFEEHTTPIGKDNEGNNIYTYTSNQHIKELVGDCEELVVCGFHAQDCVMRVAEYFYSTNTNTIVDEELTDFLSTLSKRFYFNNGNYNLANRLTYDEAEDMLMYKKPFVTIMSHYVERFKKPYFHVERFFSDFTLEECMQKLIEIEETKRQSRSLK